MRLSDILELRKAKYIKRTGSPGNYRYWYKDASGKLVARQTSSLYSDRYAEHDTAIKKQVKEQKESGTYETGKTKAEATAAKEKLPPKSKDVVLGVKKTSQGQKSRKQETASKRVHAYYATIKRKDKPPIQGWFTADELKSHKAKGAEVTEHEHRVINKKTKKKDKKNKTKKGDVTNKVDRAGGFEGKLKRGGSYDENHPGGGEVQKARISLRQVLELRKAKYIRRTGSKGNYRYYYADPRTGRHEPTFMNQDEGAKKYSKQGEAKKKGSTDSKLNAIFKPGTKVVIDSKTANKGKTDEHEVVRIMTPDGSALHHMEFDSVAEAKKYAEKKELKVQGEKSKAEIKAEYEAFWKKNQKKMEDGTLSDAERAQFKKLSDAFGETAERKEPVQHKAGSTWKNYVNNDASDMLIEYLSDAESRDMTTKDTYEFFADTLKEDYLVTSYKDFLGWAGANLSKVKGIREHLSDKLLSRLKTGKADSSDIQRALRMLDE